MAKAGASVVINGHHGMAAIDNVVSEVRNAGGQAIGCLADVSDCDAVRAMVDKAAAAFGKVDIILSNVAVRSPKPFPEITQEQWDFTVRTNLSASFHLAQAALPHMIRQNWGRVIHIVGGSNFFAYTTQRAASVTAKSGMHGLTKALAREFGPQGITVNMVAPGFVKTEHDWSKYQQQNHDEVMRCSHVQGGAC